MFVVTNLSTQEGDLRETARWGDITFSGQHLIRNVIVGLLVVLDLSEGHMVVYRQCCIEMY